MTVAETGENPLPGMQEQATTGKKKAAAPVSPRVTQPEPPVAPGNKLRRARVREEVDSDYAEEAEDFFYGEGM
jgi:hypothetical protein